MHRHWHSDCCDRETATPDAPLVCEHPPFVLALCSALRLPVQGQASMSSLQPAQQDSSSFPTGLLACHNGCMCLPVCCRRLICCFVQRHPAATLLTPQCIAHHGDRLHGRLIRLVLSFDTAHTHAAAAAAAAAAEALKQVFATLLRLRVLDQATPAFKAASSMLIASGSFQ